MVSVVAKQVVTTITDAVKDAPPFMLAAYLLLSLFVLTQIFYLLIYTVAPTPRDILRSETTYKHIDDNGSVSSSKPLPYWKNAYDQRKKTAQKKGNLSDGSIDIEDAEVFMSLVVPAFNEEKRLGIMLREAVDYLQKEYGKDKPNTATNGSIRRRPKGAQEQNGHVGLRNGSAEKLPAGWEVLIISDGSKDKTVDTALEFARSLGTEAAGSIRVISLVENRGKGGAVTHGMRHVRGKYAVFADADGASKFEDLGKLLRELKKVQDDNGRGVAVGSRAHLVGSDEVVKRSFLRNLLMHSFHLLLWILTPKATAAIRDTQCGFKLFSRPALPYIVPYMHSESWIFDVEMLMLAEAASIPVAEVPIGWHEVQGSKLNVLWDSLGMAWGLFVLRAAWAMGVYSRT
ncbi:MAG: hypothetical protein L6R38_008722 [Xanthoria sp. 2 TBL-2021]|nr:MAG: hypothetical protein L6R38_008722 [Xanthoria sp. 2 TBL-2021]